MWFQWHRLRVGKTTLCYSDHSFDLGAGMWLKSVSSQWLVGIPQGFWTRDPCAPGDTGCRCDAMVALSVPWAQKQHTEQAWNERLTEKRNLNSRQIRLEAYELSRCESQYISILLKPVRLWSSANCHQSIRTNSLLALLFSKLLSSPFLLCYKDEFKLHSECPYQKNVLLELWSQGGGASMHVTTWAAGCRMSSKWH